MSTGHTLELDDYELANLREALTACLAFTYLKDEPSPLEAMNNGDWLGQILWRLPQIDYKPNMTAAELRKRARDWMSWQKPQ